MAHYEFRPDEFTLADLRLGEALTSEDKARLQLAPDSASVRLSPLGGPATLAEWSNELGLQVSTLDALVALVSTQRLTIAGCDRNTWTDVDFVMQFGIPHGRERLSETLVQLHWRQGAMAAFFVDSELVSFRISETD